MAKEATQRLKATEGCCISNKIAFYLISIVLLRTESSAIVQSIPNSDSKGRTPFHADRHGNSDNPRLHQTWSIFLMGNVVCNVPLHSGANTCEITARGLSHSFYKNGGYGRHYTKLSDSKLYFHVYETE